MGCRSVELVLSFNNHFTTFTYGDSSREPDTLEKLTFFGKNLNDLYFT